MFGWILRYKQLVEFDYNDIDLRRENLIIINPLIVLSKATTIT